MRDESSFLNEVAATSEASFLKDEVLPDVPWRQIIAVRHRLVHAYFDLAWQILAPEFPNSAAG